MHLAVTSLDSSNAVNLPIHADNQSPAPISQIPLSAFNIKGITGTSEVLVDNQLVGSAVPKLHWDLSDGATEYKITIFSDDLSGVVCPMQVVSAVSVYQQQQADCNLTLNTWYRANITAKNSTNELAAANDFYRFYVRSPPITLNIGLTDLDGIIGSAMLTSNVNHGVGSGSGIYSGWATGIGDFNGDGFSDIAAGKRHDDLYVIYGSASGIPHNLDLSTMTAAQGFYYTQAGREYWGSKISAVGDLDKDGFDDFIVGAPDDVNPLGTGTYKGSVQIIYGRADHTLGLTTANIRTFWDENHLGGNLYPFGDFNGDGWIDLFLGAGELGWSDVNGSHGYVYYGKSSRFSGNTYTNTLTSADGFAVNDSTLVSWQSTVAGANLNNDGKHDLLFGNYDSTERVYAVFGNTGMSDNFLLTSVNGTNGFYITNGQANSNFSFDIGDAKDINGDGFDDIIISAPYFDAGGKNDRGAVYVFFGGPQALWNTDTDGVISTSQLNGTNGFVIYGENAGDRLGDTLDGIGDFNGDGFNDILITSPGGDSVDNLVADVGRSYVIFGGEVGIKGNSNANAIFDLNDLDASSGIKYFGNATYDIETGSPAGDVNNDGFADIILSTGSTAQADGQIFIINGF